MTNDWNPTKSDIASADGRHRVRSIFDNCTWCPYIILTIPDVGYSRNGVYLLLYQLCLFLIIL